MMIRMMPPVVEAEAWNSLVGGMNGGGWDFSVCGMDALNMSGFGSGRGLAGVAGSDNVEDGYGEPRRRLAGKGVWAGREHCD
jgi:hypothetical protein